MGCAFTLADRRPCVVPLAARSRGILRDESGQCSVRGLYPCGEGAGYAGGILSAAADGMRCAEKIWEVYSG